MNRRKGPDWLVICLKYSNILLWSLIFISIFFRDLARPEEKTLFDHLFYVERPQIWDTELLFNSLIVAYILLVFAILSLIINVLRNKRDTDHIHKSIIFSILLSIFFIIQISLKLF